MMIKHKTKRPVEEEDFGLTLYDQRSAEKQWRQ